MSIRLFLDSSALFSGIVSATSAARALLLLAETEHIEVMISEQAVTETERAIARRIPSALSGCRQAILASRARIVRDPPRADVKAHQGWIAQPADASILVAAMHAKADYLVTLDRKHLIDHPDVARRSGLRIGSPGDALLWIRQRLSTEQE